MCRRDQQHPPIRPKTLPGFAATNYFSPLNLSFFFFLITTTVNWILLPNCVRIMDRVPGVRAKEWIETAVRTSTGTRAPDWPESVVSKLDLQEFPRTNWRELASSAAPNLVDNRPRKSCRNRLRPYPRSAAQNHQRFVSYHRWTSFSFYR